MSLRHTRKSFFAKLLGLVAGAGLVPKLLAKPVAAVSGADRSPDVPFAVRTEKRAVARSSDTV